MLKIKFSQLRKHAISKQLAVAHAVVYLNVTRLRGSIQKISLRHFQGLRDPDFWVGIQLLRGVGKESGERLGFPSGARGS
jgi:hypothetical protein